MTYTAPDSLPAQTTVVIVAVSVEDASKTDTCIIRGHGTGEYDAAIRMDEPASSFRKFTLEMGEPVNIKWDVAILVREDDQVVDIIRVHGRPEFSVLRANSTENTVVQNCCFVIDDGKTKDRVFELVAITIPHMSQTLTLEVGPGDAPEGTYSAATPTMHW